MERPDKKSKKAEILAYLEAHQIDHNPEDTNMVLLALIPKEDESSDNAENQDAPEPEEAKEVVESKGKYSVKELEKKSKDYFKRFPTLDVIYATEDGAFFFERHNAKGAKGPTAIVHSFNK